MRVAIISDIHANLQALQAVLLDIKQNNIDSIVCLGDIVGYGPRPKQVLEEVTCRTENIILGNHDAVIGNRLNPNEFNENAHEAIDWTRNCLGDDSAKFFGKVPTTLQFDDILCVHAEAAEPENWNYITTPESALPSFLTSDASLIFMGHTHLPGIFSFDPATQQVTQTPPQDSFFNPHQRHLINVGSVGDPRDGDINACYTILDMESRHVSFRRTPFDYEAFRADQLSTGLKHKSWFLKLIDSQAQDIAPMGDMTARPTSLVTGHINRRIPSISLSPLVNTPTKLASAEKSQNRLAFFGVAAIVICFIGLVMIIGSNSDESEPDKKTAVVAPKKVQKNTTPSKQFTPPLRPTKPVLSNTPNPSGPPVIANNSDTSEKPPTPTITGSITAPDRDKTPPVKDFNRSLERSEVIKQLAQAFFAKDLEKAKGLTKRISPDDNDLKSLAEKLISADKTILDSFRPSIGKNLKISLSNRREPLEVRIEKVSNTAISCSRKGNSIDFTLEKLSLKYRVDLLSQDEKSDLLSQDEKSDIRYLYGGIEAAHSGDHVKSHKSLSHINDDELRPAFKDAFTNYVISSTRQELLNLLAENSIPINEGDLEKTIDAIWSGPKDLEATKSLQEEIKLIREKLDEVKASADPLYLELDNLQKALSKEYEQGLIVKFFGNRKHEGEPVVTDTAREVDANWSKEPAQGIDENEFSTTWTGFIKPRESDTYEFKVELDDEGDITFLHPNEGTYPNKVEFELTLEAGTFYPFKIKHIEWYGEASAKFRWRPKGEGDYTIVPKEVLFRLPLGE